MCLGLAEPNGPLPCISADQCMKFCDDTPSVATPHTEYSTEFTLFGDQLKCMLMDCLAQLSQDTLYRAISQQLRLTMVMKVKGANIEFRLD